MSQQQRLQQGTRNNLVPNGDYIDQPVAAGLNSPALSQQQQQHSTLSVASGEWAPNG